MEDLPLGRIAAFVSEFAVKDLPFGRTLMMMMMMMMYLILMIIFERKICDIAGTRTTDLQFSVLTP